MVKEQPENNENICRFSEGNHTTADLFVFQFVYETIPQILENPRTYPAFCCYLMTEGTALLETDAGSFPLQAGDLFFTYPSVPFSILNCSKAKYIYLSFVGNKTSDFLESMGISRKIPVYKPQHNLRDMWFQGILLTTQKNMNCLAKGILLYTLGILSVSSSNSISPKTERVVQTIRNAVDCSYANTELSLQYLCKLYNYNLSYVSRKFREELGMSFSDYLQSCRLYHACNLLKGTNRSISEIAYSVGYWDPLYFSKVFKKHKGISPAVYRASDTNPNE